MANNIFTVKRTSTAGRQPNTTGSYATNSQYISAGEFALNMADGILYTSNGSDIIEVGANNSKLSTNGDVILTTNGKTVKFAAKNTSSYAYFSQQTDDNFVFYSTDTSYNPRAVWSIFANSTTSNLNISVRTQFNGGLYIPTGVTLLDSTGSQGSAGQILASNGSGNVYWVSPGAASVNTAAQFTWSNTHTFQANVSFTGNGIGFSTNTGAIYFNQLTDANWKIGRNTGATTKYYYTNNSLDIIAANSNLEGIVFGWTGNSYLETGYAGTFTRLPIYVGNSSVNTTINSTSFTGTANNASYLGGTAAASYVQNTDSRTLSGNLTYTGANLVILGTNTYITSNVLINGVASFKSVSGQANASGGTFIGNAYATLGGAGGNYLAFGQQTNFSQWIQSGYSAASPVYYDIILNPLGGNTGIGNTLPNHKLSVNGSTYLQGQVTFTQGITDSTGVQGNPGSILTSNGSGNVYWSSTANNATNLNAQPASYYTNATNITTGTLPYAQIPANIVNTTGSFTLSGNTTLAGTNTVISSNLNVTGTFINVASAFVVNSTGAYHTGTMNAASYTVGTTFTANSTLVNAAALNVVANSSTNNLFVNNKIQIGTPGAFDFATLAVIEIDANQNTYSQIVIQNANTGNNASSDLVLTADTGNDSVDFIDFGINNSLYNQAAFSINGPKDGYLYASNGNISIGTASAKELIFHANGTTSTDRKLTINATAVTIANTVGLFANGSYGSAGQLLTTNGSAVYWSTVTGGGGGSVNTDAQYVWTNTHTFNANLTFGNSTFANTTVTSFSGFSNPQSLTSGVFQTNASLNTVLVGPYTVSDGNSLIITAGSRLVVI